MEQKYYVYKISTEFMIKIVVKVCKHIFDIRDTLFYKEIMCLYWNIVFPMFEKVSWVWD